MKNKPLIVFDTNFLISANLVKDSVTARTYDKAVQIGKLVRCQRTFDEFEIRFARNKFNKYLTAEERRAAIEKFRSIRELWEVSTQVTACRDPDDDKFLSLAVAVNAACIITGDKDLLALHPFRSIQIITPAQFLQSF